MSHLFEGTPQYEQQYGFGAEGRHGNGLGNVGGADCSTESGDERSRQRMSRRPGCSEPFSEDEYFLEEEADDEEPRMIGDLSVLTPKQRFVIERRYGLLSEGCRYTLDEIARAMGVSNQAVSRLERSALSMLENLHVGEGFTPRRQP